MNIKVLKRTKHNGTVYEKDSTILNMPDEEAERLIKLNAAVETEENLEYLVESNSNFIPNGSPSEEDSAEEVVNPKQDKSSKRGKKKDEE